MNSLLLVSVVTGVYNREWGLPVMPDNIISQSCVDFGATFFVEGSTEGTRSILAKWATARSRMKICKNERYSLTQSVITGCWLTTGKFSSRKGMDDPTRPVRLKIQRDLLANSVTLAA